MALECHDFKATVSMMALNMTSDSNFEVILGCDWLQKNRADIMFSTDSLHIGCAKSDGQTYDWPIVDDGVYHNVNVVCLLLQLMFSILRRSILMLMIERSYRMRTLLIAVQQLTLATWPYLMKLSKV